MEYNFPRVPRIPLPVPVFLVLYIAFVKRNILPQKPCGKSGKETSSRPLFA